MNKRRKGKMPLGHFAQLSTVARKKTEVLCPWCPTEEKHPINVYEIQRFWEQDLLDSDIEVRPSKKKKESQPGEKLRKPEDDAYPFEYTEILGKFEMGKLIGRIQLKEGSPVGTGFRVGSKYVMTAYHVMSNNLEILWRKKRKMLTKEEIKEIKWTTDKVPVTGYWNISNFIPSLDSTRKAKLKELEKNVIGQYEIKFEFLKEGAGRTAEFKHDIAFASPEHDALVLELAEQEFDPKSFSLLEDIFRDEKLHVFGHPNGNALQHDPGCKIIKDEGELSALKTEGIKFFKKELPKEKHEIENDYASCVISDDNILFHSSSSTAHGASGAPLIIVHKGTPKVYGMLLMGHPKIFYNRSIKIEKKHLQLLVESGISMKKVRSLLHESSLPELEKELFCDP